MNERTQNAPSSPKNMTHLFWVYTAKRCKISKRNKRENTHIQEKKNKAKQTHNRETKKGRREGLRFYYLTNSHVSGTDIPGDQHRQTSWETHSDCLLDKNTPDVFVPLQVHLKHDFGGDLCVATGEGAGHTSERVSAGNTFSRNTKTRGGEGKKGNSYQTSRRKKKKIPFST